MKVCGVRHELSGTGAAAMGLLYGVGNKHVCAQAAGQTQMHVRGDLRRAACLGAARLGAACLGVACLGAAYLGAACQARDMGFSGGLGVLCTKCAFFFANVHLLHYRRSDV